MLGQSLIKTDRFPITIGAFVAENRAPSSREVELLARFMSRGINEEYLISGQNDFEHKIENGYYWRIVRIPASSIIIGKEHKIAHTCFVQSGKLSIYSTVDGVAHLDAGDNFPASANSRKVGFAQEDTVFITCTPCQTNDLIEVEQELFR